MLTLRVRLWLLILLVALPGIGMQVYTHSELGREREADATDAARALASQVNSETDRIVEGARGILVALSELPFIKQPDAEKCSIYLGDLLRRYEQFNNIAIIGRDGNPLCASVPVARNINFTDRFYFNDALARGFSIGTYVVGKMVRQPSLPFALAIQDDGGEPTAVGVISLDLLWLGEYYKRRFVPSGAAITLADRNGMILSTTEPDVKIGTQLTPQRLELLQSGKEGVVEQADAHGQRQIIAFVPVSLPPQGIWVMTALPKDAVVGEAQQAASRELSIIGALVALTLLAAGLVAEWFIRRPVLRVLEESIAAASAEANSTDRPRRAA